MYSKDALKVTIKLVGLAIFLFGVIEAARYFPALLSTIGENGFPQYSVPLIIAFVTPSLLGLLLWLLPSKVASTIIPSGFKPSNTNEFLIGLEGVAIRILGFYFLYICLTSFLNTYISYSQTLEQNKFDEMFSGRKNYYLLFGTQAVEFILSILLIFGSKTIVRFVRKLRYAS